MVKEEGESEIETIVTYKINNGHSKIITPCGMCLETLRHFGNPFVIVSDGYSNNKKVRLDRLVAGSQYLGR